MASTTNFGYNIGDVLKEYLDDPIFILNKDYEFEYITENFLLKQLGLNSLKAKMTDILQPNYSQRAVDFLQKVLKFEHAVETMMIRYGDTPKFYEFKGRLFKNETQEIKYLITTRDITKFKKKEEDWNQRKEDLKKLDENMQEIRFWKLLQTKDEKNSFQKSTEMIKQSEEKYRHLFESSPYAIWIVDLNGILVDCNPTTNIMFSRDTRENLVGKHFVEVLGMLERPEYFIPFFKSKFEDFVQDKKMKALEFKMTRADGQQKWIHITSSKIKLGDDTFIQAIIQDITEKKLAELKLQRSEEELKILNKELEKKVQERTKELKESEEKFRTIAESSLMGIAIIQDNKIKYVNQLSTSLTGYTVDETKDLSPAKVFEFIHPEDRNWVVEQLRKKQSGSLDYN